MKRVILLLIAVSVLLHLYATDNRIYENIHVWSTAGSLGYDWRDRHNLENVQHLAEFPLKLTYYIRDLESVPENKVRAAIAMTFELLTDHPAYVEGEEVTIHFSSADIGKYVNFMVLNEYSVHRDFDFVLNEKTRSVSFVFNLRERYVPRLPAWRSFSYIVTFSRYYFEAENVLDEELANHYRQIRLPISYERLYEIPETWKGKSLRE